MKLIKKFILLAIISAYIGKSYGTKDATPAPQAAVTPSPTPVIVDIAEEKIFSTEPEINLIASFSLLSFEQFTTNI